MKKFVTAALATALAGSVSFADPGDNEWLELDSEINNLATNLRPAKDGNGWSALIRATYAYSGDEIATGDPDASDVGHLNLDDVDLAFWGAVGEYSWRISVDIDGDAPASDVAGLEDAYVTWACGDAFTATMGNFKASVLHSNMVDPENQLMIDRTALGSAFDNWDAGAGAHGSWEDISWYASFQNGADASASANWAVRVEMDLGEEMAMMEGAMGGGEQLNASVGLSYVLDDSSAGGEQSYFADVNGNMGPIGFGAEVGMIGDNVTNLSAGGPGSDWSHTAAAVAFSGDSSPWSFTGSYLVNEKVEVGLRYEDLDNADGNTILSFVANWYQAEHNAKWQAQWSSFGADDTNPDGSIFQVGVVVGASR